MSFIDDIAKYRSLSIVGTEKNTGKTECLNFVLSKLSPLERKICVTSIGIDGESIDQVSGGHKPEIVLREGFFFATSEKHYRQREILSEVLDIGNESTSLGRIITAKALSKGKILLSGPSSGPSLKSWAEGLSKFDIDLTIIDGALSRLTSASPAISQAMILSTGAALSASLSTLVQKSVFLVEMINLDLAGQEDIERFSDLFSGIYSVGDDGLVEMLKTTSALSLAEIRGEKRGGIKKLYISGALTDRLLKIINDDKELSGVELIVRDFTKIFITPQSYRYFIREGGVIKVLQKSKLLAICINPLSPSGYVLDSEQLRAMIHEKTGVPVYDIKRNFDEI